MRAGPPIWSIQRHTGAADAPQQPIVPLRRRRGAMAGANPSRACVRTASLSSMTPNRIARHVAVTPFDRLETGCAAHLHSCMRGSSARACPHSGGGEIMTSVSEAHHGRAGHAYPHVCHQTIHTGCGQAARTPSSNPRQAACCACIACATNAGSCLRGDPELAWRKRFAGPAQRRAQIKPALKAMSPPWRNNDQPFARRIAGGSARLIHMFVIR